MKKKIFALLMSMVLVLGMSTTAMADINSPVGDNTPTINSPTGTNTPIKVTVDGLMFEYMGDAAGYGLFGVEEGVTVTDLVIPAECCGLPVIGIFDAFKGNTTITSVTIPKSVKMIDAYSFNGCSNLTKLIYDGVEYTNIVPFQSAYAANGGWFGSDSPAYFEFGGTGLKNEKEPVKLNVTWSTTVPWLVEFEDVVTMNDDYQCFVDVLKDGEYVGNTGLWEEIGNNKLGFDVAYIVAMNGSGKYTVEVSVLDMSTRTPVAKEVSAVCVYTKPAKQLANPTVKVDLEKDELVFEPVEGAYAYYIWLWQTYADVESETIYDIIPAENVDDDKVEYDLQGFAEFVEYLKENCLDQDRKITFGVIAISENINTVAATDCVKVVGYENKVTKEQAKESFDKAFEGEELDTDVAVDVLSGVSNETIVELLETDAEFAKNVEKLEDTLVEDFGDGYKGATSETELVDATKVSVVGLAINAYYEYANEVELTFVEPEKKVDVDKKYENAVQLDISLMVDGNALENLAVPVTITMPIPTGVAKENLVILHYHGDAKEPAVIVPTVNEDGTMTFIVSGFSTFVVTNEVVEEAPAPEAPKTGDTSGTALVCSLLLLAAGVVLVMKRNSFAK